MNVECAPVCIVHQLPWAMNTTGQTLSDKPSSANPIASPSVCPAAACLVALRWSRRALFSGLQPFQATEAGPDKPVSFSSPMALQWRAALELHKVTLCLTWLPKWSVVGSHPAQMSTNGHQSHVFLSSNELAVLKHSITEYLLTLSASWLVPRVVTTLNLDFFLQRCRDAISLSWLHTVCSSGNTHCGAYGSAEARRRPWGPWSASYTATLTNCYYLKKIAILAGCGL